MPLTRAQFAHVVRADEKWVENTARALNRHLTYTTNEARWLGLVRLLASEFSVSIAHAASLAQQALEHPPDTRGLAVAESNDGVAAMTLDLARYHSTFAAALSAAMHHGGPRRRGRRPARNKRSAKRDAVQAAERHGVDLSLTMAALERSPSERLARLDANVAFLGAVRPRRSRVRRA